MKEFTYVITDPVGIHARPAGKLSEKCKSYQSTVTIYKQERGVDARRLMALMGLCVKQGDSVRVTIEGSDETEAAAALQTYFKENL